MLALTEQIRDIDAITLYGRVQAIQGLMVKVTGPVHVMPLGARVTIEASPSQTIPCEVVGFEGEGALLMPFGNLEGVRRGCRALISLTPTAVRPRRPGLDGSSMPLASP